MIEENIIERLGLDEFQVLEVVRIWYTCGMYADILQDEEGRDLEEIIEQEQYEIIKSR